MCKLVSYLELMHLLYLLTYMQVYRNIHHRNDAWETMLENWCMKNDAWEMMHEKWGLKNDVWEMILEKWCLRNDAWETMNEKCKCVSPDHSNQWYTQVLTKFTDLFDVLKSKYSGKIAEREVNPLFRTSVCATQDLDSFDSNKVKVSMQYTGIQKCCHPTRTGVIVTSDV